MAGIPKGPYTFFRLSPVERAEAFCFSVFRGEISGRFDVNYWRLMPLVNQRLKNPLFAVYKLGQMVEQVQYGCSALAMVEPIGTPMLRMNNLQHDGWDLNDLKYIDLSDSEMDNYKLAIEDILFNRTNSKDLVGKCEVFREPGDWVFASYLIRVRTDRSRLLPQFASDFLSAGIGRLQIDAFSRQIIGMTNINAEEIRELRIPTPPVSEQKRLITVMDAARAERQTKLAEADALLAGLDDYLLAALGLIPPPKVNREVFAVLSHDLDDHARLNADYFHPERIRVIHALRSAGQPFQACRLDQVVHFIHKQIRTPGENYMSLANVESNTGELVQVDEEVTGACSVFQPGDVLFARLRPYLNKVYAAERNGCCSPEFYVLRSRDRENLDPDYLAAVLRSNLTLSQTRHMMTGNTHPRLANEDVVNLVIPVPAPTLQRRIAAETKRRREEARRLRAEAEAGWRAAKRWFERQLLGEGDGRRDR